MGSCLLDSYYKERFMLRVEINTYVFIETPLMFSLDGLS
jgi:hypothetical protein